MTLTDWCFVVRVFQVLSWEWAFLALHDQLSSQGDACSFFPHSYDWKKCCGHVTGECVPDVLSLLTWCYNGPHGCSLIFFHTLLALAQSLLEPAELLVKISSEALPTHPWFVIDDYFIHPIHILCDVLWTVSRQVNGWCQLVHHLMAGQSCLQLRELKAEYRVPVFFPAPVGTEVH